MNLFKKVFNFLQRIFSKKDKLIDPLQNIIYCPNCNNNTWYEGPGGGSFGNIQCSKCEKWYNNLGPFGLHEIKS